MEGRLREIVELLEFFEGFFRGHVDAGDLGRLERALADDFTIVAPSSEESDRAWVVDTIRSAHGHDPEMRITIDDARLTTEDDRTVAARYVERSTA